MRVRAGNPRLGHCIGGFYVSTPVTGRHAGRRFRIGHRLPGGFWLSVPIELSASGRPARPIGSYPLAVMIGVTIVYTGLALVLLFAGAWFFAVPLLIVTVVCWLRWAANPQQRR